MTRAGERGVAYWTVGCDPGTHRTADMRTTVLSFASSCVRCGYTVHLLWRWRSQPEPPERHDNKDQFDREILIACVGDSPLRYAGMYVCDMCVVRAHRWQIDCCIGLDTPLINEYSVVPSRCSPRC